MLVLFETPAGYALFKVKDDSVSSVESVTKHFADEKSAKKAAKLKDFKKFADTEEALAATSVLVEGTGIDKGLKSFLKKAFKDSSEKLAVCDAKFGNLIKEKLNIPCVYDSTIAELFRGIRTHLNELVEGLDAGAMKAMSVGLSHSLARYKLKFSTDKVDTMIIQAIGLLDDLDKELNTYAMRVREWYGWHFPELGKIVNDNLMFAQTIVKMGMRSNAANLSFGDIMPEEMETDMKQMAIISMGTEISESDLMNVQLLAKQVISISEYRTQLFDYLQNRMAAIAPNLTMMVGEMVGARLIAHAGSLINLAKQPASTVQILGAEKALFRALKTKKETPKYGLIYHASMVGQAATKNKGKVSRVLAAKTALSVRVDALGDSSEPTIAVQDRAKVEMMMRRLEGGVATQISGTGKSQGTAEKYTPQKSSTFNPASDVVMGNGTPKKEKKDKKKKKDAEANGEEDTPKKDKKKKKDKKEKNVEEDETPKKKKKRKAEDSEEEGEKKKKKKKKSE